MIKTKKSLISIPLILIYAFLTAKHSDPAVMNFYNGIPLSSDSYMFLLNYYYFAVQSFMIFGIAESFVNNFGTLQFVRHNSRIHLLAWIFRRTVALIAMIEIVAVLGFAVFLWILNGKMTVAICPGIVYFALSSFVHTIMLIALQVFIELCVSAPVAIIAVQGLYILQISISDILLRHFPNSHINYIFLNNFAMKLHYDLLPGSDGFKIGFFIVMTTFFMIAIWVGGSGRFRKRDIV